LDVASLEPAVLLELPRLRAAFPTTGARLALGLPPLGLLGLIVLVVGSMCARRLAQGACALATLALLRRRRV